MNPFSKYVQTFKLQRMTFILQENGIYVRHHHYLQQLFKVMYCLKTSV